MLCDSILKVVAFGTFWCSHLQHVGPLLGFFEDISAVKLFESRVLIPVIVEFQSKYPM
jgi:hypothetical protein